MSVNRTVDLGDFAPGPAGRLVRRPPGHLRICCTTSRPPFQALAGHAVRRTCIVTPHHGRNYRHEDRLFRSWPDGFGIRAPRCAPMATRSTSGTAAPPRRRRSRHTARGRSATRPRRWHGAERIHLSLSDDVSVDAVLEPIAATIPAAVWIVDHTTTAVRPTAERIARWNSRGRTFVHAPVFMGPVNAQEGTGLMLVSGEKSRHDALLPALQQMTGNVVYMGAAPERAAAFKLFGNLTLIGMLGVLGDVNRLAHAVGIPTARRSRSSSTSTPASSCRPARRGSKRASSPRPLSKFRWRART